MIASNESEQDGYPPPGQDRIGYTTHTREKMGYPSPPHHRASTRYAVGGMSFAYTPEDFLVLKVKFVDW